jgi:acyl carrier protein
VLDKKDGCMTPANEEIFQELCRLLEPFNKVNATLSRKTDISSDLNIDSVSVMDFIMEIEDKYDIDIPLNMLSDIRTLDELSNVVASRMPGV